MHKSARTVDNPAQIVDKFGQGERPFASASTDVHRVAQTRGLTLLRTLGPRSPIRGGPERVRRSTSEDELIRGYGLDPEQLDLEERQWRRS